VKFQSGGRHSSFVTLAAENGMTEFSEFHLGGGLLGDGLQSHRELHQSTVNPVRNAIAEQNRGRNGSDQKLKILLLRVFIEARGCQPGGSGSGYGYLIANTGATHVEWHDGWTRDEAAYQAIRRAIEDVPAGSQVLFRVKRIWLATCWMTLLPEASTFTQPNVTHIAKRVATPRGTKPQSWFRECG